MFVVAGHGGTNVGQYFDDDHPLMYFTEVRNGSVLIDVEGPTLTLKNVRIDGQVTDTFSIVKERGLRLVSPEPGALLARGATVAIDWIGAGTSGEIELAYGSGDEWTPIATVPDEGRFVWTPDKQLGAVKLRVRDPSDVSLADELDGTVEVLGRAPQRLIPFGSLWRYTVENQDGKDWTGLEYRDTRWEEGRAKIGVCGCLPWDCGCETYVTDALVTQSLYLRKHVDVNAVPSAMRLRALYETGMVVFVNGVEIFRRNVGDEAFESTAVGDATYAETVDELLSIPEPSPFVVGENVVAVLMKKSAENGNLSFDLELTLLAEGAGSEGCGCSSVERVDFQTTSDIAYRYLHAMTRSLVFFRATLGEALR
jgi:hypothetical protein